MKNYEKCYELVKTIIYERGGGGWLHYLPFIMINFWNFEIFTQLKRPKICLAEQMVSFFVNISPGFNNKSSLQRIHHFYDRNLD